MKTLTKVFLGLMFLMWVITMFSKPTSTVSPQSAPVVSKAEQEAASAKTEDMLGIKCLNPKSKYSYIGEISERTLKCGWGKPEKINRTIYASGTREQWVYESGNYLYFTDGVLTAMQN